MQTLPDRLTLIGVEDLDRFPAVPCDPTPWFAERVRTAVHALTSKQQEVVELYYFQGWTETAIAEHLGIRQQVVHKRIHGTVRDGRRIGGALARLRAELGTLARVARWA